MCSVIREECKQTVPGENGDGGGDYLQTQLAKQEKFESGNAGDVSGEKKVTEIFFRGNDKTNAIGSGVPSASTILEYLTASKPVSSLDDEMCPKLESASGSRMEIQPSPIPLQSKGKKLSVPGMKAYSSSCVAPLEGKECKTVIPKSSTLVLKRDFNNPGGFCGPIEIMNSTSFLHGFAVVCNKYSAEQLNVSPRIGLIAPHKQVSVMVKTNSLKVIQSVDKRCKLEVKIFRSFCEDPSSLKEYYKKLSEQHPELIQAQPIERVLVWNNDFSAVDSIDDRKELESVKEQIENCTKTFPDVVDNRVTLNTIKTNMLLANQNLREVFHELTNIRNMLHFFMFVLICVFGFTMVMPYIVTKVKVEDVMTPVPQGPWNKYMLLMQDIIWDTSEKLAYVRDRVINHVAGYF